MIILAKKIGKGEFNWKGIVVPRKKAGAFPGQEVAFDLFDGTRTYKVKLDRQSRIRLTAWFRDHPEAKEGSDVVFTQDGGRYRISVGSSPDGRFSLKDVLGKETKEGRIVDVQQTPRGLIAVIEKTKEVPLEEILREGVKS